MTTIHTSFFTELDDKELVARSIAGEVGAFGEIAGRYYPLIRSLAYGATGSLSQSDDLARDTFVVAWKQVGDLREPVKLRSWLCGIAHTLINNFLCQRNDGQCLDLFLGLALAQAD